jgi:signal transduction histidine kinase
MKRIFGQPSVEARIAARLAALRIDPHATLLPDTALPADAQAELAALQRHLRAADCREARFASVAVSLAKASHDLRGLLSPALLVSERLQVHADPSVSRTGDMLIRLVERASDLLRDIVAEARDGVAAAPPTRFALGAMLDEAIAQFAAERAALGLPAPAMAHRGTEGLEATGNRDMLRRAIVALLRHAATAAAGRIGMAATTRPAGLIHIEMADDGVDRSDEESGIALARDLLRGCGGDVVTQAREREADRITLVTLPARRGDAT